MSKLFESILDQCLVHPRERQACLARYPQYADQLRALVQVARLIEWSPQPVPRPEAWHRGQALLFQAIGRRRSPRGTGPTYARRSEFDRWAAKPRPQRWATTGKGNGQS